MKEKIEALKIERRSSAVPLWIDGFHQRFLIVDVIKTVSTGRLPKSDFCLVTDAGGLIHISHKGITFQQYGGVSDVLDHPTVADFLAKLPNPGVPKGHSGYARYLRWNDQRDQHLIKRAVFGIDYQDSCYGPNNVHLVAHGDTDIVPNTGEDFRLVASKSLYVNRKHDTLPIDAVLGAILLLSMHKSGRKTGALVDTRTGISSRAHRNTDLLEFV